MYIICFDEYDERYQVIHGLKPNTTPSHKSNDFTGDIVDQNGFSELTNKEQVCLNTASPQDMHFLRTQAVRLLPLLVSLTVISVPWVTRAQNSAEVIRALLFTGGLGTDVIIWKRRM